MKSQSLFSIITTFLLFAIHASAFSLSDLLGENLKAGLIPRQDNTQSTSAARATTSRTAAASASESGSQTATDSDQPEQTGSATQSGSGTRSGTITGTRSATGTVSRGGNSTRTSAIDLRLPAGGISMLTPAPLAGMTFVKVGDQVTFAWNYTSLLVTPSYIDVVATNNVNSQSYTIAGNASWDATQTVIWDTGAYSQTGEAPFVVATYTLLVYDSAGDPTAVASAGHLGTYNQLRFGVYTAQPYVPLDQFKCASCSGAMSIHEKQALSVLVGTCVMTILSFTWFASGFGLI